MLRDGENAMNVSVHALKPDATLRVLILLAALLVGGCVSNVGTTRFPEASANFSPKRTYAVPLSAAYEKVERTLDDARIPIANQNKSDSSARIQTDYIEGQSQLIAGGFVAAQSTRYRYHVTLRPNEKGTTINILCNVESTMKGQSGASPWTDVSGQNPQLTAKLEAWLYEQIEKNL